MRKAVFLASLLCTALPAHAGVIYATNFSELSSAITTANSDPGSTIYLAPGTYSGGSLPNILATMTISLDPASGGAFGSAILATTPTGSKGILTVPSGFSDINLTVNGLTFENATISDADGGNGAGIRYQGAGAAALLVTNSVFVGNQNGILTGYGGALADELLTVSISDSLFANNGSGSGFTHGIYIQGYSLNVSNSVFCGTNVGHDIKTRTAVTNVSNSEFYDGIAGPDPLCGIGSASYSIDMPNGGDATITDSLFVQGAASDNPAIISYGAEGIAYSDLSLIVSGNTFTSTITGTAIQELAGGTPFCHTPVQLSNNIFSATLNRVIPPSCIAAVVDPGDPEPVDEPATLAMMGGILLGLVSWQRRRRQRLAI